jgi:aspartate aminotransferase
MKFSQRICSMQASPIRKLAPYAAEAKEKGKKIYFLNIGQPDIKTPQAFFDAVGNFKNEVLAYGSSEGDTRLIDAAHLRERASEHYQTRRAPRRCF